MLEPLEPLEPTSPEIDVHGAATESCTNVDAPTESLTLGADNGCIGFSEPDSTVGDSAVGEFFLENPGDSSVNTADEFIGSAGVKSFVCS
ncbi:hypothetical protein B0H17DRAFT_1214829 [Mycena rosella]|uniref:Uncharacterized protein n=1 Tax=Mycena rosella TaxID=1033263 RepID=A0AAD7CM78_MYCRO|nr:hypothetical protein B0H17DRAFT_1214829 [Mycena rosella]